MRILPSITTTLPKWSRISKPGKESRIARLQTEETEQGAQLGLPQSLTLLRQPVSADVMHQYMTSTHVNENGV
jgi:hypothetical protein